MVRRRNGSHPLYQLRDDMDRLVGDFFSPWARAYAAPPQARSFPALNVWEESDALYAEAEVPGLKGEDLDISVVGNDLEWSIYRRAGKVLADLLDQVETSSTSRRGVVSRLRAQAALVLPTEREAA